MSSESHTLRRGYLAPQPRLRARGEFYIYKVSLNFACCLFIWLFSKGYIGNGYETERSFIKSPLLNVMHWHFHCDAIFCVPKHTIKDGWCPLGTRVICCQWKQAFSAAPSAISARWTTFLSGVTCSKFPLSCPCEEPDVGNVSRHCLWPALHEQGCLTKPPCV